tara:strand:+ start:428 stop:1129 length:702 start_codon:yes stop_codon:yes gene_type:complete
MVKKLVAVGCSYTDPCYTFPVWPELLAKKLNFKCINLGQSGSGNECIFSKSLDILVKEKNIGLMVVMWSEFQRMDYYLGDIRGWDAIHYNVDGMIRNVRKWKEDVVDLLDTNGYNNKKHQINRTLRFMYSLQKLCGMYDVPFLQVFGTEPCPQNEKYDAGKTMLNSPFFDSIECLGWPVIDNMGGWTIDTKLNRDTHRISERDSHPNKEGHEVMSEILFDNVKKIPIRGEWNV